MTVLPHARQGLTRRSSFTFIAAGLLAACRPFGSGEVVGQKVADPVARRFYALRSGKPAWSHGKAEALKKIIGGAQAHGLMPTAFAPKALPGLGEDEALTVSALAYAKALSSGFVDPHKIEPIYTLQGDRDDLAAGLAQALDKGDLEEWYAALPPGDPEYSALSAAYLTALNQAGLPAAPATGAPVGDSMAPADQARQLAANLERRRWLSRRPPAHRIDVNTAGAFLGYFLPNQPVAVRPVVVGRDDHPTPSLQAAFKRLVVNPPWRVPMGIAEKEIFPKGPEYMASQNMTVKDGLVEQAPGPDSALGLVKFDVEDRYDIYLHDTPSKALFSQPERHRSHGCVRVQNAVDFARSIAAETGKAEAFDQALASGETTTVELGQTIPVRLLYHTAYLDQSGKVLLDDDVYGTDDKLANALGQRQAAAATRRTEPDILFGP